MPSYQDSMDEIVACDNTNRVSRSAIFNLHAARILKTFSACLLVRGTDLFSLRLSNRRMTIPNTTVAVWCQWVGSEKNVFFGVLRTLVISLHVP